MLYIATKIKTKLNLRHICISTVKNISYARELYNLLCVDFVVVVVVAVHKTTTAVQLTTNKARIYGAL